MSNGSAGLALEWVEAAMEPGEENACTGMLPEIVAATGALRYRGP